MNSIMQHTSARQTGRVRRLLSLSLILMILFTLTGAVSAAPTAGPCVPGATYDPACDVDQDGDVDIFDVQKTAGHWGQTGTFVSDNNHNHLGQTWTGTNNPLQITGSFGGGEPALLVSNSAGIGLRVAAGGLDVATASGNGIRVGTAASDGVFIYSAGQNGVRVSSAGYGLTVGHATYDGLFVVAADGSGVSVQYAQTGVYVGAADSHGMVVQMTNSDGVRVESAAFNGVYANTTDPNNEWGFYTPDKVYGSNVLLGALSVVAQVTGADALEPGDVTATVGVTAPLPGSAAHLPLVRRAGAPGSSIIGVVEGRLALSSRADAPAGELRRADGPAQPGDYVALTLVGAAQVKVAGPVTVGQRLTAHAQPGYARPLRTRLLDGMEVTEGAPVLGAALESLAAGEGLIWVYVNLK